MTLEDILREIVGEIRDEFDDVDVPFDKQGDGSFLVDATVSVDEFSKAFEFQFPEGEFETVGGFLSKLSGSIPEVGERFTSGNLIFTVHSKDGPRLERVRVAKVKALEEAPAKSVPKLVGPETRS